MTVDLKSQDLVLGQATILNVVLKPGNNTVSLRGNLDIDKVLDNFSDIVESQRDALQNGELELTATGNSTTYNGVHIPYYETILKGLDLTATCRGSPSSWLSCLHAMPLKPIPIFSIFNISRLIDKNSIKHNSRKIHSIDFPTLLLLSSLYHHHHHHHLPHTSIINQSSYHLSPESKY